MTGPSAAAALPYYRVTRDGGAVCDLALAADRVEQLRDQGWTVTARAAR